MRVILILIALLVSAQEAVAAIRLKQLDDVAPDGRIGRRVRRWDT